ncbi:MAG: hypothetical protein QNK37_08090 [Acidobacteriota bacterium]|nr:hypothetical protein [Acidobacteriota bacterium]
MAADKKSLKATNLTEVIRRMDSKTPLAHEHQAEWDAFYTNTGRIEVDHLIQAFITRPRGYKSLFGGHSGNGKTTELSRFKWDPRIRQRFFLVDMDVSDSLNPDDLEIAELLLMITLEVFGYAEMHKVPVNPRLLNQYEAIRGHFHKTMKRETEKKKISSLDFKKSFFAVVRAQAEVRETLREYYRPRLEELVRCLDDLILEIAATDEERTALLLIDGLDRTSVEKARTLFVSNSHFLAMIRHASFSGSHH